MKIYMTTGTFDYLKKIVEKYSNEEMAVMINEDHALILHETNGNTFFKAPRSFDVLESDGDIKNAVFIDINNITVTDEGRLLIEHHFKNCHEIILSEPGYIAFRFLKPLYSNTYILLTAWRSEHAFLEWKKSTSFQLLYNKKDYLSTASYHSKYFIPEII